MTNSKNRREAEAIIKRVFELIDEEYLHHRIDEAIEEAAKNFNYNETATVRHQTFLQLTGDFVRHIYEHGFRLRQITSVSQARAEALAILESGYESLEARGYEAAILDASNPKLNGLEYVLGQMTEFITFRARHRHIRWVYSSRIDPSDWPIKCLIVEILLERWGPFLPSTVLTCTTAQLANSLPELLEVLRCTTNIVRKTMGADTNLSTFSEML